MKNSSKDNIKDYNQEPVKYCTRCYSLHIESIDGVDNSDYCAKCGCTEIAETDIGNWEMMYKKRYGRSFVDEHRDPCRSHIYSLTLSGLKQALYALPQYREIIRSLYPSFPRHLTKVDTILLFFDKLCKDSRVVELREVLIKEGHSMNS